MYKLSNYNRHLSTRKTSNTYKYLHKNAKNAKHIFVIVEKNINIAKAYNHKKKCNYTEDCEETSKITKTSEDDISVKDVMVMMIINN